MLTNDDIQKALQAEYIPFFQLALLNVPDEGKYVVKPFSVAADLILSVLRAPRRIKVVIGTSPFVLNLGTDEIRITLNEPTINTSAGDAVFLDWKKMVDESFEYQVAMILEEFVHAFMSVSNEELTQKIVVSLYKEVKLVNGRYGI